MCVCPSACRFVSFNVEVKGQGHNKFSILHCDTIFLKVFSMQSVAFILYKKVFLYQKKIPIYHKCLSVCLWSLWCNSYSILNSFQKKASSYIWIFIIKLYINLYTYFLFIHGVSIYMYMFMHIHTYTCI